MDKFQWFQSQVQTGETIAEAVSRLNTARPIQNPEPRGKVRRPVTIPDLVACTTVQERFAITETQTYKLALEAFRSGNLTDTMYYFQILVEAGKVSQESAGKITSLFSQEIDDPDYQETISLSPAQEAGFGVLLVGDFQAEPENHG